MNRDESKQTSEDQGSDDQPGDDTLESISADYYDRSWKNRLKVERHDVWIAVGLYLVLSSVAFVILV